MVPCETSLLELRTVSEVALPLDLGEYGARMQVLHQCLQTRQPEYCQCDQVRQGVLLHTTSTYSVVLEKLRKEWLRTATLIQVGFNTSLHTNVQQESTGKQWQHEFGIIYEFKEPRQPTTREGQRNLITEKAAVVR